MRRTLICTCPTVEAQDSPVRIAEPGCFRMVCVAVGQELSDPLGGTVFWQVKDHATGKVMDVPPSPETVGQDRATAERAG